VSLPLHLVFPDFVLPAKHPYPHPMFVERKVCYSVLFTILVRWHGGAVSFPSDVILAQLACPLSDVIFCLHSGKTNLSLY
jgi:hypothetical protein